MLTLSARPRCGGHRRLLVLIPAFLLLAMFLTACGSQAETLGVQYCCGDHGKTAPTMVPADTQPATLTDRNDTVQLVAWAGYHFQKGDHHEALAFVDSAIVIDSRSARLQDARSRTLERLNRFGEAETALLHALYLGYPESRALYALGECQWKSEQYDRAIATFEKALGYFPENACILNSMGRTHELKGSVVVALDFYNRAIARDPRVDFFFYNRARVHRILGNEDAEVQDLITARTITESPGDSYRPLIARGLIND